MVQVISLRSFLLISIMCLGLCLAQVSTDIPKEASPTTAKAGASSKDHITNNTTTPDVSGGSPSTLTHEPADDADMLPDEPEFPVKVPSKDSPVVSNPTKTNTTTKDPTMTGKPLPAVKVPAKDTPATTSSVHKANDPLKPQTVPAPIPGIMSADGKCTCPSEPDVSPPATTDSQDPGLNSPPEPVDVGAPVPTDTSSTNPLKVSTKFYFMTVVAVVGFNSLFT
ncbi:hypothetical protein DFH28DRAFT_987233, partial [Melampsora americana]